MASRPPSPPYGKSYFSVPFERFVRDDTFDQLTGAFTLLGRPTFCPPSTMWHLVDFSSDTVETYFDSHVDLLQRKLQKHSDRLKLKAEETFKIKDLKIKDLKIKDLSGDLLAENLEREIKNFKIKVCPGGLNIVCSDATVPAFKPCYIPICFLAICQGCAHA